MFSLENKHAVVTGGGSGIGKAVSLLFAAQGATVHVVDVNEMNGNQTVSEIKSTQGKAFGYTCDVTNQQEMIKVFQKINRINILVNSAGISHIGKVHTTSESDFDLVYRVNVKGVYNCLYAAIPLMKKNGGGVILNMSSIADK